MERWNAMQSEAIQVLNDVIKGNIKGENIFVVESDDNDDDDDEATKIAMMKANVKANVKKQPKPAAPKPKSNHNY